MTQKTKTYKTIEELNVHRLELVQKFNGDLPEYLCEYFDHIAKRLTIKGTRNLIKEKGADKKQVLDYIYKGLALKESLDYIEPEPKPINPDRKIKNIDQEENTLSQDEIELLKATCESNIYAFAVRYFGHYLKKPSSKFHRYLYGYLNRQFSKKNRKSFKKAIAAPRGGAKSSIISVILPLWCICYEKKHFIIIVSDTATKAESFLEDLKRELLLNEKLMRDFPHAIGKGPMWRANEIITNNDIKVKVFGTGNNIRGERYGIYRPDLLIGDDIESRESVKSVIIREDIRTNWFNKDVLFIGGDENKTDFLIVGTILGKDALLNQLMDPKEYPDWDSKRFAAVIKFSMSDKWKTWEAIYKDRLNAFRVNEAYQYFKDNKDEMLEGTEVLWPEGENYYKLMVAKISDESGFTSEKQNDPSDPTKILVRREELTFKNFKTNPDIQAILKNPRTNYYISIDPSLGKNKTSDNSVITTLARCSITGALLVVDIDVERRNIDKQVMDLLKKCDKYKPQKVAVETNAFQIVIAENLRKLSKKLHIYVSIEELQNYSDKHMRIEGIIPLLKDGTVIFDSHKLTENQSYNYAIDEIVTYQLGVKHDDVPDGLEQCIRICKTVRFQMTMKKNR